MKVTHLLRSPGGRAVCGTVTYKRGTTNPALVTCKGCRRTEFMAHAEADALRGNAGGFSGERQNP